MATNKQKEELMQTLKFTPRNYRVEITGYGGEVYWGAVDRKIYDFFKEHKVDIEEYASDWDDEKWEFIPEDLRPFSPGSPYDVGGVHQSGATFDENSTVTVYDELGEEVWSCPLGIDALEAAGVSVESAGDEYISEYEEGTVVFYGAQGEKGLFFGNEFELRQPFDPKKLSISYNDHDGWEMVYGVSYNGEEIGGSDYDTSGKWAENKWIIVGGEEIYEGVSRDDMIEVDLEDDE